MPLYVQFGDEEFQAGVDLTTEQFWDRLLAPGAPIPTTSAPSPATSETFEASFAGRRRRDRLPHPRYQALGDVPERDAGGPGLPDREIHVIDTSSTSMSTGSRP